MSDWLTRLTAELDHVEGRMKKLRDFMEGGDAGKYRTLDWMDQDLLYRQLEAMHQYRMILEARMARAIRASASRSGVGAGTANKQGGAK